LAQTTAGENHIRIHLESPEDVWFWERRFNVFDFLELFPESAITEPVPDTHVPPPAATQLSFETDAGFVFTTDIVRGGFYLRNQTQGTRKWMAARQVQAGDTIEIRRVDETHYRLSKLTVS
jgi:hypothetical protein